jgi:hypothetical protein
VGWRVRGEVRRRALGLWNQEEGELTTCPLIADGGDLASSDPINVSGGDFGEGPPGCCDVTASLGVHVLGIHVIGVRVHVRKGH